MTDGVRRLSHDEAEMLISARMDEQLDRADSRALLVHLQTCESCRAFAVQSEVLGRELTALPVLPASAMVDRQMRETLSRKPGRWSLVALMPAAATNNGLRLAVGALAMLTLVSVFLLVRMAGDQSGEGPTIDAPNGGVAQQIDRTPTEASMVFGETAGPTETPRRVVPMTQESEPADTEVPAQKSAEPTEAAGETAEPQDSSSAPPTATLDSNFVYAIDKTKTPAPAPESSKPTATSASSQPEPTEQSGEVAVAAVGADDGSPVIDAETATVEGAQSPVATPNEDETAAPEETASISAEESPADAAEETEAPTEEPATEIPATTAPEPTATATPVEISVDATEPAVEPTTPPPAGDSTIAIEPGSGDDAATPDTSSEASAPPAQTETPVSPTPTETPTEPFGQPTIAPISGQTTSDQETGDPAGDAGESPQIVPNDGTDVGNGEGQNAGNDNSDEQGKPETPQGVDDNGSSPAIQPSDGTNVPDGVGGDNGTQAYGGESDESSAIPTVDDSVEPSGLDLSDTVTELPSGTSSTVGRLEFSPGMNLYTVIAPDGQLAVADLAGELVVTLGGVDLPVWSGSGLMFSSPGESGTQVGIWNSDSGELSYIPSSEDEASNDVPVGGDGSTFYYLRTYPDSGILELRSATIDGSDNGVIWTSDSASLSGDRPAYSDNGILLPTESEWLLIDFSGGETSLGENPHGYIGAPVLSPGGGLMAYSAGDQVIVAWTEAPGQAAATAPFSAPGGYAFATSGEQIVVSDGTSLHAISYTGDDLGTLSGNQPIGAVYWISDTIYYLQIGEDAALKSTSLNAIQSE